jgi:hypothetical protein
MAILTRPRSRSARQHHGENNTCEDVAHGYPPTNERDEHITLALCAKVAAASALGSSREAPGGPRWHFAPSPFFLTHRCVGRFWGDACPHTAAKRLPRWGKCHPSPIFAVRGAGDSPGKHTPGNVHATKTQAFEETAAPSALGRSPRARTASTPDATASAPAALRPPDCRAGGDGRRAWSLLGR